MKKITKLTGNIRLVGQAEKDGVAFRAQRCRGPGIHPAGTLATVQNNSIICNHWNEDIPKTPTHAKIAMFERIALAITSILGISSLIAFFAFGTFAGKSYDVLFNMAYIMIGASYLSEGIGIFIGRILGDKEIKSFSKFLAAKNAVQNAYYDLGKVPNIDEVKNYSTFSCDSEYISSSEAGSASLWMGFILIHLLPHPWFLLGMLALIVILFILLKKNMLFFWQFLTVSEPEEIHYQSAITALEECINCIDFLVQDSVRISPDLSPNFREEKCKACAYYNSCKEHSNQNNSINNA